MARLSRVSSHKRMLLANDYIEIVSRQHCRATIILTNYVHPDTIKGKDARRLEKEPEYKYEITLQHGEIAKLLSSIRAFELASKLTPDEFHQWIELSKKAFGKFYVL